MKYVSSKLEINSIVLKINTNKLVAANASDLKSEMLSCVGSGSFNTVAVDLSAVDFLDSSGLGALVSVRKHILPEQTMEVRNPNEFVAKVLALTKMDRVFSIL